MQKLILKLNLLDKSLQSITSSCKCLHSNFHTFEWTVQPSFCNVHLQVYYLHSSLIIPQLPFIQLLMMGIFLQNLDVLAQLKIRVKDIFLWQNHKDEEMLGRQWHIPDQFRLLFLYTSSLKSWNILIKLELAM